MADLPNAEQRTDALGAEVHVGTVLLDVAGCPHTVDRLDPYPGRFVGDHARVAHGDGWERTICDHQHYRVDVAELSAPGGTQ